MANLATLLSVTRNILGSLRYLVFKEICMKSEVKGLLSTISAIKNMLLEAEAKQDVTPEVRGWMERRLTDAVHAIDDFFDELVTLALVVENGGGLEAACCLFSSRRQWLEEITYSMDSFVANLRSFGFRFDYNPILVRRTQQTSCKIYVKVVGRDNDLNVLVSMLLDSNTSVQEDCYFLSIVGVGGIGKTTLAQLVYNDDRIMREFPVMLWVCVSDFDGQDFDLKTIVAKIVASASDGRVDDSDSLEMLVQRFDDFLRGRKFFIVLDDLWNEDPYKWAQLTDFLRIGGRGSRVVVTTRSRSTAKILGDGQQAMYELNGLSEEHSWHLFQRTAFEQQDGQVEPPELVEIGRKIVKLCSYVPLAIEVTASLLYSQDLSKWVSFLEGGRAKITRSFMIMSVLSLSYDNLEPAVKSCFSYCALFPEDFVIDKGMLIRLWMAQGYIVPEHEDQSIEVAGEEYFSVLLNRCFFDVVEKDDSGEVISCKVHSLMHGFAQLVASNQICVAESFSSYLGDGICHLFQAGEQATDFWSRKTTIRSYLQGGVHQLQLETLVAHWTSLRVLDLHGLDVQSLPDSIGGLLHLRYLDLSHNRYLAALPNSIVKLYNLQTLDLRFCNLLRELPPEFSKLVNLRYLDVFGCDGLTSKSSDADKLTCLQVLPQFVVAERNSREEQFDVHQRDLEGLVQSMPDFGALLCITENLLATSKSLIIKKICSNSQLEELIYSVSNIRKVIIDAEAKQKKLSMEKRDGLQKLRDSVYATDDYIDELLTLSHHCDLMGSGQKGKEVRRLLTSRSQGLEQLKNNLRRIAVDLSKIDSKPVRKGRDETCSYKCRGVVVGREKDLNAVVDMLLDSSIKENFSCLAIVGMGGIGKTTLAQQVYNDERVKNEFSLRSWVCVSDIDGRDFDVEAILIKALKLKTSVKEEDLHKYLLEVLGGNKSLFVLDGLWNENPEKWAAMREFLKVGGRGSRILVTTRSMDAARIAVLGDANAIYQLNGLSKDDSWLLFRMTALPDSYNQVYQPDLIEIGEKIVQSCSNIPLIIKVLGNTLLRKEKSMWLWFQEGGPTRITQLSEIMLVLRLSYDNLKPPLKSCFSYCAIFPDNFVIRKRMLIGLWMAQGYIIPFNKGQSIECAGEEYFSILLSRCFFEVVEKDEHGDIFSCRVHSLMLGVAREVSRKEIFVADSIAKTSMDEICHLFQTREKFAEISFSKTTIRSYLRHGFNWLPVEELIANCTSLRVLDLHGLDIRSLPDSISGLVHLRYLDLSHNRYLEALPDTIAELYNLQTLDLSFCTLLRKLPQGISELLRLSCLDLFGCEGLTFMPSGMDRLTCLQVLPMFLVSEGSSVEKQFGSQLRDLNSLVNLKGHVYISIPESFKRTELKVGCLEAKEHLKSVWIRFLDSPSVDNYDERDINYHQALVSKLKPHPNLRELLLWGYQGLTIPRWGRSEDNWATILPHLVRIELRSCERLQQLPLLSQLRCLQSLKLHGLRNLEYLEKTSISSTSAAAFEPGFKAGESELFPSLEELEMVNAPRLWGFWIINQGKLHVDDGDNILRWGSSEYHIASFPLNLTRLELRSCKRLNHLPSLSKLPYLKSLILFGLANLEYLEEISSSSTLAAASGSQLMEGDSKFFPSLEELEIVNAPKLKQCWMGLGSRDYNIMAFRAASCFPSLKYLMLAHLPELHVWPCTEHGIVDGEERYENYSYKQKFDRLTELRVSDCPKLMWMPLMPSIQLLEAINIHWKLLKHLVFAQGTRASVSSVSKIHKMDIVSVIELDCLSVNLFNIEALTIKRCKELSSLDLGSPAYVKRLTIHECDMLKYISRSMEHLSILEDLEIEACEELNWDMKDDGGEGSNENPWAALQSLKNLRSLKLTNISKIELLPRSLDCLTKLEQLSLCWLYNLRALPDWIGQLSQLSRLSIRHCPNLNMLPDSLGSLCTLQQLEIQSCPRLEQLPHSFAAVEPLQLVIRQCPKLQRRLQMADGGN